MLKRLRNKRGEIVTIAVWGAFLTIVAIGGLLHGNKPVNKQTITPACLGSLLYCK